VGDGHPDMVVSFRSERSSDAHLTEVRLNVAATHRWEN